MPISVFAYNCWHFVLFAKLHLKGIYWVIFSRIIHVFRYGYVFIFGIRIFWNSKTTISERFSNMNDRIKKMFLFNRSPYNLIWLYNWFRVNLYAPSCVLILLLRLFIRVIIFSIYIFNSKITILTKRISSRWRIFA